MRRIAVVGAMRTRGWIRWLPLASFVAAAVGAALIVKAETPFGIGNGVVPTAAGRSTCDATHAIVRRGLRFRYATESRVYDHAAQHAPAGVSPDLCDARIVGQSPAAGTHLPERAVVTIRSECEDRGCG